MNSRKSKLNRTLDNNTSYISCAPLREKVKALLTEIQHWTPGEIRLHARDNNMISMWTELLDRPDRVFALLIPRRQSCLIYTGPWDTDENWTISRTPYRVHADTNLTKIKNRMRATIKELHRSA